MSIPRIVKQKLLTSKEAAGHLSTSLRQLGYLTAEGEIKQTRLPNTEKRLYDILDLDDFIEQLKIKKT
ncbi:hypothetical protein GWO43_26550 [candidate division KSB1 bacterium]|nr:hypothetical protein [candidate division KSB1 bacterium]NIT74362.1 hypothetical protein [candidate division KSB1 bacterium]NIX74042.1 hypothetical protein [candidate division KSB1 bacterium]